MSDSKDEQRSWNSIIQILHDQMQESGDPGPTPQQKMHNIEEAIDLLILDLIDEEFKVKDKLRSASRKMSEARLAWSRSEDGKDRAKSIVTQVIADAAQNKEESQYYTDDGHVNWGRLEKDLHEEIDGEHE